MKLVVFGLTLSSSWGNGHATLWRGLCRALARQGHRVVFFERDVPYYAGHRDLRALPGTDLVLYPDWRGTLSRAGREVEDADVVMATSYCPDGVAACDLILDQHRALTVFYDLDTPVTLERLDAGEEVPYLPPYGLGGFDLVLSYTGGAALDALRDRLGAVRVAPLYGSVDPEAHRPSASLPEMRADLSYIGTYAADRQEGLDRLFLEPARRLPDRRFVIAGAQYPQDFPWTPNLFFVRHLPPADHPAFYGSSPLTLNVTRAAMARMGWCPSGRLFEAAACGTACLSDTWEGLDQFFEPGREILLAETPEDAVAALTLPSEEIARIGRAARERALAEHTADHRARELLDLLGEGAA
ncbi:MAG TPA: glycosyltransferase [Thermoanaerobaculia bacterium]|jgi:spore maturation protein CgeB|nr:glycosyltransferase [Thermoanaerobaculia bacterium]